MRMVPKQVETYNNDRLIEHVSFDELPSVDMIYNIVSEKDKVKTVKTIERMVRGSLEYKEYIRFLRDYIEMSKCSYFGNVKSDRYSKTKIEIHHSPFTLYDITMVILLKHLEEFGNVNLFEVSEEVMKLHYQCRVGLIPLSTTVHKLVHEIQILSDEVGIMPWLLLVICLFLIIALISKYSSLLLTSLRIFANSALCR